MKNQVSSYVVRLLFVTSLVALVLVFLFIVFPPSIGTDSYIRKQLVGTIFAALCVAGILSALLPSRCLSTSAAHTPITISNSNLGIFRGPTVKGHHVDCGRFSRHVIRFKHAVFCAACLGLAIGSLFALALIVFYFFLGLEFSQFDVVAIILGELSVLAGFAQTKLQGLFRLLANSLFVVGASSIIVGMDDYGESLFVDLFLIGAVLLWIITRISLSQEDHRRICVACGISCRRERKWRKLSVYGSFHK